MKLHRIINQRLRNAEGKAIGDVNAAVAVNVGESGGSETHVSSHSRIVQRSARTNPGEPEARQPPRDAAHETKEDA